MQSQTRTVDVGPEVADAPNERERQGGVEKKSADGPGDVPRQQLQKRMSYSSGGPDKEPKQNESTPSSDRRSKWPGTMPQAPK